MHLIINHFLFYQARDAQFLTLLEKIIAEQKEQRRLLQLIISKGPAVEENSLTLPEGVTFPIKSVDDMDSFNELLQESEVYSRVVSIVTSFVLTYFFVLEDWFKKPVIFELNTIYNSNSSLY